MKMLAYFYVLTESTYHFFSVSATVRIDKFVPKTLL